MSIKHKIFDDEDDYESDDSMEYDNIPVESKNRTEFEPFKISSHTRKRVLLIIAKSGGENGIAFIERYFHEIDEDGKIQIIRELIKAGGEAKFRFVKKYFYKLDDDAKTQILLAVVEYGGKAGLWFLNDLFNKNY